MSVPVFRSSRPARQQGTAHTNPKRERGSAVIDCEQGHTDSTATYQVATAAPTAIRDALASARSNINRLRAAGFALSRNDRKIIVYGQLLTTLASARDAAKFAALVDAELSRDECCAPSFVLRCTRSCSSRMHRSVTVTASVPRAFRH